MIKYFYIHIFYFIWNTYSSKWIINSTFTTLINTEDTHFIRHSNLEANDSPKCLVMKVLINPINNFLINPNIILYCIFSLNIYEYPKHHEHQYYHNRIKNHRDILIIQSFSYYQLKNLFTICCFEFV